MTEKFEQTSVWGKGARPTEIYQRNEKLRKDIYFEIRKLNKTLQTDRRDSRHAMIIEKFLDAMIPSGTGEDAGRLPISASKPCSPKRNKLMCVYYLVSRVIQSYWNFLRDESDENLKLANIGLELLKYTNKNFDKMDIVGNEKEGYSLQVNRR